MLWICLHFPDLPLDVFARGAARGSPAVVSSASHRPDVVVANAAAKKRGIVPGLSIASALALDPELAIHLRDEESESAALRSIALWAGQWTPTVSIEPPGCVLLEVAGALRLFGGLERLLRRIDAGLAEIGFQGEIAVAPTAGAAALLARAQRECTLEDPAKIERALSSLPVALLAHAQGALETLCALGVHAIGELLALPRDGVARRFGQALIDEIDRALGRLPEARPPFVPPERYHGQLELPAPVEQAEALLFGARRLAVELAGFLQGRGAGVTRLRCDLVHEDEAPTSLVLGLTATRQVEHIMTVLRERLAREVLPDRVEAIRLVTEEIAPLAAAEGDFFAASKNAEAGAQLIERLRARLGEDAVRRLALHPDHRPEWAGGHTTRVGPLALSLSKPVLSKVEGGEGSQSDACGWCSVHGSTSSPRTEMVQSLPLRPLWLLPEPYALAAGPTGAVLQLVSGPERIESGWWDGFEVGRDYFVGRNARDEEQWLYRDRSGRWFVHGIFA
ncbi:MAG TPA: DNA polymerase Y family protein [Casimicrobiaceae bacterium]